MPDIPSSNTSGALHCPNCGADAAAESIRCTYCGSTLAKVACPKCFGTIFVGMSHCPWCGGAAAQPVPQDAKALPCPRCNAGMDFVQLGQCSLSQCSHCGGLWVDKETFEKICDDRTQQEAVLGEPAQAQATESVSHAKMYIPCPSCKKVMNRINFAGCSGIILDWCKEHGTWFDHNELRQVVDFIQAGGMKKSRERELENLRAEQQKLSLMQRQTMMQDARLGGNFREECDWLKESGSFASFLSSLWSVLRDK